MLLGVLIRDACAGHQHRQRRLGRGCPRLHEAAGRGHGRRPSPDSLRVRPRPRPRGQDHHGRAVPERKCSGSLCGALSRSLTKVLCCSLPSSPRSTRRASATRCPASTVRSSPSSPRRAATCVGSDLLCAQPSTLASAESTPANTAWATPSTRSRWSEGRPPSRNGKDLAQRCFARPVIG